MDYQHLIQEHILENADFVSATFSGMQRGHTMPWKKLVLRPVLIKEVRHLQFSYFDERQNIVKNYAGTEAAEQLEDALALPFRNFNIRTAGETIQIQLSKKGKPLISRTPNDAAPDLSHDRRKAVFLHEGDDVPYLRAVGLTTQDNRVKADRRDKFKQINQFLRIVADVEQIAALPDPVRVVDFGCGKAYLTFAAHDFLTRALDKQVEMVGVDIRPDLQAENNRIAAELGWNMRFAAMPILDYVTDTPPDVVLALHACDTASDDALAQAIRWRSPVILAAPCCHHDLQAQLKNQPAPQPFAPVLRYGLLHERLGDIITDSFRTLILQSLGYQVDVVEFVDVDHTPRNLLIRAVRVSDTPNAAALEEYMRLKAFWNVTPHLHMLLGDMLPDMS
ncbi:MAG: SAM-dependent methyltransferase [Anaerolineae bacterium]